ncbi:MAG TPA: UvrD-helicase domain-containing protein [Kamptonema sp.]|nr:UvrD-helicase domain-containing protein [Kamptonema sp.]
MELSSYQTNIVNWVKTGTGHGCCNAVAGSGKTTTLRIAAIALQEAGIKPHDIKVAVFGKANSLDLVKKFGNEWRESISTLHSAGWSLVKKFLSIQNSYDVEVKSNKYKSIAQDLELIGRRGTIGDLKLKGAIARDEDFTKLIDLVRLTNQEPTVETILEIGEHFEMPDLFEPNIIATAIAEVLAIGENLANQKIKFDFTDQIWLPVKWQLHKQRWFSPYKFVLIDECQDLNAAQLELAIALAGNEGRLLFVGDPRQAIMGFAGADCNSYQNILERTKATELPLSLCYRCPSDHIKLVKWNFPEIPIEANPEAIAGKIEAIATDDLWSDKHCKLTLGDMVICRKTAPLVNLCIRLIGRGIAATVKGKAIGEQIKGDLQDIAKMPNFTYPEFHKAVLLYRTAKAERYRGLDNEEQLIEMLKDKLDALTEIYKSQPRATTIAHLEYYIDNLFSDESSPITLSTCHRAKGLEGDRIFILRPEEMPMVWRNQQDWQLEQEYNLLYVALTRSKSELYLIGNPNWLPKSLSTVNPTVNVKPEVEEDFTEQTVNPTVNDTNTVDVYAESTLCNIEYISGSEQHSSTWSKFWIKGLDQWAVRETDGEPESDKHSNYYQFICLDIPDDTVFTIFEQDGDKHGTSDFNFWICKTSRNQASISSSKRHCTGNFETVCEGIGKTKAPRLMDWWQQAEKFTNEQKLAFAEHCAQHINKRGIKTLPPFEPPTVKPTVKEEILQPVAEELPTVNTTVKGDNPITSTIENEETINPTINSDTSLMVAVKSALIADPLRSDRFLAKICGTSAPTVAKWRKRLLEEGLIDSNGKRLGANGKTIKTDNIGTKSKPVQTKILELAETLSKEEIEEIIKLLERLK